MDGCPSNGRQRADFVCIEQRNDAAQSLGSAMAQGFQGAPRNVGHATVPRAQANGAEPNRGRAQLPSTAVRSGTGYVGLHGSRLEPRAVGGAGQDRHKQLTEHIVADQYDQASLEKLVDHYD